MRIADAVASLSSRPDAMLVGNEAAESIARTVAEQLGMPAVTERVVPDQQVVVLVAVEQVDLTTAVDTAIERAGALRDVEHCLVLVDGRNDGLPVDATAAVAARHGLELVDVLDVGHPTLTVALHLLSAPDADLAAARTELRLEREVSRRARTAAAAAARELDRRGERIDVLQAEVTELRERLETADVRNERAISTRDRQLTALRREVGQLETSTSYRIGHALVRLVKDPSLLRRVPGRLMRWLRS